MHTLTEWQEILHKTAKEHGWWDKKRPVPELLCLIHSEVSEGLEAYRKGDMIGLAEEMADVFIRLADMAEGLGIDLEEVVAAKHEVNKHRPYRHGNKVC